MRGPRASVRVYDPGGAPGIRMMLSPVRIGAMVGLCLLASACGPVGGVAKGPHAPGKIAPGDKDGDKSAATVGPAIAPLPAIPDAGSAAAAATTPAAPQPVEKIAPIPTPMETFRTLTHEEGLKLTPLFATPVTDTDARLKRLEDAVQGMRNDFDTVMPTMVRMVTMENSIRELIDQLHTINGEAGETPGQPAPDAMGPFQPAPETAQAQETPEKAGPPDRNLPPAVKEAVSESGTGAEADGKPTPLQANAAPEAGAGAAAPASGVLKALRIADHGAQSRLVVDMSSQATLPVTIEDGGKRLVIGANGMRWDGAAAQAVTNSSLIRSYKYENGSLYIELSRAAKIDRRQVLPPSGDAGYRTVIDIAPAS